MSVQKFEGIVEVEGITTDGAKGSIDFTPDIAEERSNFEVGDSLGTIIAKTNRNIEDLGELAFMDETDLPDFGDLATKDEAELNIPRDIDDLTNSVGFGRPVLAQEYTTVNFNNDVSISLPTSPARLPTDIFKISAVCNDSTYNYFIDGTYLTQFSENTYLYFCTIHKDNGSLTFDIADSVTKIVSLNAELELSSFGISGGEGTVTLYYK